MDKIVSGVPHQCSAQKLKEKFALLAVHAVCLVFLTGSAYGVLGEAAYPGTEVFALLLLASASYIGGTVVSFIGFPPLLGMLIVGVVFRNVSAIPYSQDISIQWAATFRDIALAVILLNAGLGLDPQKLMMLKLDVVKLSFVPCLVETAASGLIVHNLLGLPWLWSFMLGFIVSAVSAAVLVPGMLDLERTARGVDSGIPTLLMASVSADNVVALTGFMITFSILTSEESLTWAITTRILEPLIGFITGAIIGVFLWYLPLGSFSKNSLVFHRSVLLTLGCLSFVLVSKRVDMSGAGALGCVSLALVSSLRWRSDSGQSQNLSYVTGILWSLIEPFLFGLIGAEVTIESLQSNLGMTVLSLLLGAVIRALATVAVLSGSQLNFKEKAFVSATWLSKATVQAAVGSQALDYARTHTTELHFEEYSKQVLTMSVVSIVLTAPLGAAFIEYLSPYLLESSGNTSVCSTESSEEEERERISGVTVTDYGSRRCSSMGELEGFLKVSNQTLMNETQNFNKLVL